MQFKQLVILFVLIFCAQKLIKESFHSGALPAKNSNMWWDPRNTPRPYGLEPSQEAQGEPTLTNLYRKWHNIEGVNRIGVFEHSHIKTPGGGGGAHRQFYIAEALDREAQKMQKLIRDDIALRRRPHTDAYNDGYAPLGGNFNQCHLGDCQWQQDVEGRILGIPSVPGVRHPYY